MSSWKLTVGKLAHAWRDYPRQRRELASQPPGPPIFVTGTHRSGTTWFAKMLAVPGLWYVHEPFNPNKHLWREAFTYARPDSCRPEIDAYTHRLLRGQLRQTLNLANADHPWMPLRLLSQPVRRVMIKDPLACLLTGYLTAHFNLTTVVLFRHPAGFVASVTRLGWPSGEFLRDFLTRGPLMADHLEPYRELMERHVQGVGVEAAAVLHGVLNTVIWNQAEANPTIRRFCFEELCRDPITAFAGLFSEMGLTYTDATREHHTALCLNGSPNPSDYHAHAVARKSTAMAASWRQQLTPDQIGAVRRIWNQFHTPLYLDDEQWA